MAIVGGLLVARFVGLDSDQLTSRKLIADAEDRLAVARRRADAAQRDLTRWEARDFLGEDVAKAIATGETELRELRKLAPTRLTDDELRIVISDAVTDIEALREWLSSEPVLDRIRAAEYRWRNFSNDDMPALHYPQLRRAIFKMFAAQLARHDEQERLREEKSRREEERRRAEEERERQARLPGSLLESAAGFRLSEAFAGIGSMDHLGKILGETTRYSLPEALLAPVRPDSAVIIEANRYDDLVASAIRARQRVEDLEEELRRLRQQHAYVKPDARLWAAVAILTAYAIAGVAVPLWIMSTGPASLSAVRWTFWPFAVGLTALIGYVAWYLRDLARRHRQWATTDADSTPSGSLLSQAVEVQAVACRDRVDQGLQLGWRGPVRPCLPPALQRDRGVQPGAYRA